METNELELGCCRKQWALRTSRSGNDSSTTTHSTQMSHWNNRRHHSSLQQKSDRRTMSVNLKLPVTRHLSILCMSCQPCPLAHCLHSDITHSDGWPFRCSTHWPKRRDSLPSPILISYLSRIQRLTILTITKHSMEQHGSNITKSRSCFL
jgi:hypothetical protein